MRVRSIARRLLGKVSADHRERLLQELPLDSVGAEVGVWKGDFSARLLTRARTLYLVDPWIYQPAPEYSESWYGGGSMNQAAMDDVYAGVCRRFGDDPRVVIHRMPSVTAAEEVAAESVDWVYIDGDHAFDAVRTDLQAWWPKLRPGGLLAGDDYHSSGWWGDDVQRAVAEFVEAHQAPFSLYGNQFLIRKLTLG